MGAYVCACMWQLVDDGGFPLFSLILGDTVSNKNWNSPVWLVASEPRGSTALHLLKGSRWAIFLVWVFGFFCWWWLFLFVLVFFFLFFFGGGVVVVVVCIVYRTRIIETKYPVLWASLDHTCGHARPGILRVLSPSPCPFVFHVVMLSFSDVTVKRRCLLFPCSTRVDFIRLANDTVIRWGFAFYFCFKENI